MAGEVLSRQNFQPAPRYEDCLFLILPSYFFYYILFLIRRRHSILVSLKKEKFDSR
jgi:hypothetical protein